MAGCVAAPASSAAWLKAVMRERCSGAPGCIAAKLPGGGPGGGGDAHGGEDNDRSDGEGAAIAQVHAANLASPHLFRQVLG